ncbi:hypothetical protein ACRAWF_19385 [Streptomyces sp. L7]
MIPLLSATADTGWSDGSAEAEWGSSTSAGRGRAEAVAVKVVRPELSTEPGFRRRFADEVDAARRVGGFHTAPVVDADPQGAKPAWLVTAYVPGPTLQVLLDRVGPLPADTLTVLAAGLARR